MGQGNPIYVDISNHNSRPAQTATTDHCFVKLAFHDIVTDTDILARILADTSDTRDFLKLFLWQAERHADILATILARMSGVGVVECRLYGTEMAAARLGLTSWSTATNRSKTSLHQTALSLVIFLVGGCLPGTNR